MRTAGNVARQKTEGDEMNTENKSWNALPGKNEHGDATIFICSGKEFIATMDLVSINGSPYKLPDGAESNARLIAAAPDLLSELEKAHRIIGNALQVMSFGQKHEWAKLNAQDGVDGEGTTRANEREAAIAKAEGGAE
jgi:hypothetical protein